MNTVSDGDDWSEDDEYVFMELQHKNLGLQDGTQVQILIGSHQLRLNKIPMLPMLMQENLFGNTVFTDTNDSYPLLAHSSYSQTWPKKRFDEESGVDFFGWMVCT